MSIKIASMNFGDCDTILHNTPNGMKNIAEVLGPNGEVYWSSIKELTGIPPLSIRSNGTMLLDYLISGNMSQSGAPTPENPITPSECGERTGNLCLASQNNSLTYGSFNNYIISNNTVTSTGQALLGFKCKVEPNTSYTISIKKNTSVDLRIREYSSEPTDWQTNFLIQSLNTNQTSATFTTSQDTTWILVTFWFSTEGHTVYDIMLNTGSTALPYEPYGIKIPILSAGQTNNIYLGEVPTTRKIKKLVLTGEESITRSGSSSNCYYISVSDYLYARATKIAICTHYKVEANINGAAEMIDKSLSFYANQGTISRIMYIRDASFATKEDLASYLAAQYAAGTPVTVWYVLATPTTGIVNEPLRKIGDYADTVSMEQAGVQIPTLHGNTVIDVETTLKPSQMYIKYK